MLIKTDDLVEHCVTSLLSRKMHELFRLKQTDKNRLGVKIVYDLKKNFTVYFTRQLHLDCMYRIGCTQDTLSKTVWYNFRYTMTKNETEYFFGALV